MGLKEPSKNDLPSKSNGGGKRNVVNFDFDNRPPTSSQLNESGRTTQATHSESTSSADEPDSQQQQQQQQLQLLHNNSDSSNNNNGVAGPLHQQYNDDSTINQPLLHTHISNDFTTLHASTHQAIQMSYLEQEDLSNDICKMQFRIAYLKRKIGLARQELIDKGGEDMGDELLRLSLVKEVDLSEDHDDVYDDEDGGEKKDTRNNLETMLERLDSNNNKIGCSFSSHNNNNNGPDDESDGISAASSLFRLTFGGADGMPSRWRNREMEREKTEKMEIHTSKSNNLVSGTAGDNDGDAAAGSTKVVAAAAAVTENTKEKQLITLKQLVNDRESEISFLEKEMMTVAKEKSSLENEISMMTSTMEQSKAEIENEREKLMGVIDVCQVDNRRLEKELMETTVSLDVNKMNVELLGNELREARNAFIEIQKKKDQKRKDQKRKEREKHERKRGQKIDPSHEVKECTEAQSNEPLRVARYQVPTDTGAHQNASERKSGLSRNCASLSSSGTTSGSLMSALTMDVSDLVDVLDGINSTSLR